MTTRDSEIQNATKTHIFTFVHLEILSFFQQFYMFFRFCSFKGLFSFFNVFLRPFILIHVHNAAAGGVAHFHPKTKTNSEDEFPWENHPTCRREDEFRMQRHSSRECGVSVMSKSATPFAGTLHVHLIMYPVHLFMFISSFKMYVYSWGKKRQEHHTYIRIRKQNASFPNVPKPKRYKDKTHVLPPACRCLLWRFLGRNIFINFNVFLCHFYSICFKVCHVRFFFLYCSLLFHFFICSIDKLLPMQTTDMLYHHLVLLIHGPIGRWISVSNLIPDSSVALGDMHTECKSEKQIEDAVESCLSMKHSNYSTWAAWTAVWSAEFPQLKHFLRWFVRWWAFFSCCPDTLDVRQRSDGSDGQIICPVWIHWGWSGNWINW